MTHLFRQQNTTMTNPTTTTTSTPLAMHKNSRVISKMHVQPKIRIIHIFAPEIINTDVANFRELVQRLTGKSSLEKGKGKGKKVKAPQNEAANEKIIGCKKTHINTKVDVMMGSGSSSSLSSSCDHQEAWRSTAGDQNGYLAGFNDLDYNFDFNTMFQLGAADGCGSSL